MRPLPVAQMRRLALLVVVAVAVITAGSYGLRRWRLYQVRRAAPASLPSEVQQQAEKFTLSRSEAGQTLFTLQAGRTIEREGDTTVLEDVAVVLYGRGGGRSDEIHTKRCEYDPAGSGEVYCPGKVTLLLRGAPGTSIDPVETGVPSLELQTEGVRFAIAEGTAWTDRPVDFSFRGGRGQAVGLRYQAQDPTVVLEKEVEIEVQRAGNELLRIRGARLLYFSGKLKLELLPPLEMRTSDSRLVADKLSLFLDSSFGIERMQASGNVRARRYQAGREQEMRADRTVAYYAADGLMERLDADGGVEFTSRTTESEERLTSQSAVLQFDPSHRQVRQVMAEGNAQFTVETKEETRRLQGPALTLELLAGAPEQRLLRAPKGGELHLTGAAGEQRTITANRLDLEIERGRLRSLRASGQVRTRETQPGQPARRTASEELRTEFDSKGEIVVAEQWDGFWFEDERWQAEAGRARYRAEESVFLLSEQPSLWDETTRTTARTIEIIEGTGIVRAEGEVRTTQRPSPGSTRGFGSGVIQLAAQTMEANQAEGWARYRGEARMWQGETRLAAELIELFQQPAELRARGHVSALLVEATEEAASTTQSHRAVHITSEQFTYLESERRGLFEQNVRARNEFGTLTGPRLEVFLVPDQSTGSQRLERAHASGGVHIVRGSRESVSEQADYSASAGTVVLWGGTPTVRDGQGGSTTGARLTLFLADGRIRVDSAEGIRTVTRRPRTQ